MLSRFARAFRTTLVLAFSVTVIAPASAEVAKPSSPAAYARVLRTINPHLQRFESRIYAKSLIAAARRVNIDPALVMAVVTVESSWDPHARSPDGAEGLGQLEPRTARDLGVDPWSVSDSLRGCAAYLSRLLVRFRAAPQPTREALAGYNAGPARVVAVGGVPPSKSAERYVAKVLGALATIRRRLGPPPRKSSASDDATPLVGTIVRADASFWGVDRPVSAP